MKVIFCDWHRWTFPPNNNSLKQLLKRCGVECKDMKPAPVNGSNSKLLIETNHKPKEYYRGFNVKSMIKAGVLREVKWYNYSNKVERKYMAEVMEYIDWAFETFEKEKPDYIVIEGGLTHFHRPLVEVARELNIGVIAIENSFIKNKIFIEFNTGYVCNRHSFARTSGDWINTRKLTKSKELELKRIMKNLFRTENLKYPTRGKYPYQQLKYDKTIFVPLQVCADQVIAYDSKFNNMTFVTKILDIHKKYFRDWNLILKCHPKEEKSSQWRKTGNWIINQGFLKDGIYLIRGEKSSYNTQDLIRHADLVFVNNSQAGLEAVLLEKPVVVFGDAFYANKGFTLEYDIHLNWKKVANNYEYIKNYEKAKTWFYYFYKWLYTKPFTKEDEERIKRRLNIYE